MLPAGAFHLGPKTIGHRLPQAHDGGQQSSQLMLRGCGQAQGLTKFGYGNHDLSQRDADCRFLIPWYDIGMHWRRPNSVLSALSLALFMVLVAIAIDTPRYGLPTWTPKSWNYQRSVFYNFLVDHDYVGLRLVQLFPGLKVAYWLLLLSSLFLPLCWAVAFVRRLRGRWLKRHRPLGTVTDERRCTRCGYDIRQLWPCVCCPECGEQFAMPALPAFSR